MGTLPLVSQIQQQQQQQQQQQPQKQQTVEAPPQPSLGELVRQNDYTKHVVSARDQSLHSELN